MQLCNHQSEMAYFKSQFVYVKAEGKNDQMLANISIYDDGLYDQAHPASLLLITIAHV